jgi:hypothetical protein
VVVCLLAVATAVISGAGSAAASRGKVYGVKNCSTPEVRPVRIVLACADDGVWINSTDYGHWGGKRVHAAGVLHAKTCHPSCAAGRVKDYPVKFRLYRIGRAECGDRIVRLYRRIHVHPTGKSPPRFGPYRDTKLFCT